LYLFFSRAHSLTVVTTRPGVGLWWGFSCGLVPCGGVRRPFSRVFDTPVDVLFCNGFGGVCGVPGCVIAGVRVN